MVTIEISTIIDCLAISPNECPTIEYYVIPPLANIMVPTPPHVLVVALLYVAPLAALVIVTVGVPLASKLVLSVGDIGIGVGVAL